MAYILTSVPSKKEKPPLSVTHPELSKEANGWNPDSVTYGSDIKRAWRCNLGHIWIQSPNGRTAKGETGCPYCSNQKVLTGFNDLESQNPTLAKEADGWDPKLIVAGTSKKLSWVCAVGHKWTASVASRNKQHIGCPYCSNKKVLPGFNDLATTNPALASEAFGWDPTSLSEGSGKKRDWKCNSGHIWSAGVGARSRLNEGCPYCSNQKVLPGFNDLSSTHPGLAAEARGWDPTQFNAGSQRLVLWECPLGHSYLSRIRDRARRNTNCTVCAGRLVLLGYNDLVTTDPFLAAEAFGWDPKLLTRGSQKSVVWRCSENHLWKAKVANRSILGRGCPSCAKTGFNPNKDGYLYFVSHTDWEMLQIGITNDPDKRIKEHKRLGWMLLELRWMVTLLSNGKQQFSVC